VVAGGSATYQHTFDEPGQYTLSCEVAADTNFILPPKYGANVDTASWTVDVAEVPAPPLVSGPGTGEPLRFLNRQMLVWEDALSTGAFTYNLYRGDLSELGAGYGSCHQPGLATNSATVAAAPAAGSGWFYLVTSVNPLGEGPLGLASDGQPRDNDSPCP
jgi:hypothetical protein